MRKKFFSASLRALVISAALLLFPGAAFSRHAHRSIEGVVSKVSDGDTIIVLDHLGTKVKVRLYGIDAPETDKANRKTGRVSKAGQPYGREASEALTQKVYQKLVELDVMDVDRYKRLVCLVWVGTRSINKEMVAEGWAWAYRDYLDTPYASEFIGLEESAKTKRLGLWQQLNPQPPWEFRKQLRLKKRPL